MSSNVSARLLDTIFKWDLLLIRRVGGNSFLRCNGPYNVSLIAILGLRNGYEVSYIHTFGRSSGHARNINGEGIYE